MMMSAAAAAAVAVAVPIGQFDAGDRRGKKKWQKDVSDLSVCSLSARKKERADTERLSSQTQSDFVSDSVARSVCCLSNSAQLIDDKQSERQQQQQLLRPFLLRRLV